jgi:AhpD family alkylhydroperoxidase
LFCHSNDKKNLADVTERCTPIETSMGDPVKINQKSHVMCEAFTRVREHPGKATTPKGDVCIMQARMTNPAKILPDAANGIQTVIKAIQQGGVPQSVLELVHLRPSQINGCSFCVDYGSRNLKRAGETDERIFAVAAWRESPYFSEAERAALALAEAATRLADRADPVSDEIWEEATRHYDEKGLAAIILMIAMTNLFNRVNVTIRQGAGEPW